MVDRNQYPVSVMLLFFNFSTETKEDVCGNTNMPA
jgi:hypothetical protein